MIILIVERPETENFDFFKKKSDFRYCFGKFVRPRVNKTLDVLGLMKHFDRPRVNKALTRHSFNLRMGLSRGMRTPTNTSYFSDCHLSGGC